MYGLAVIVVASFGIMLQKCIRGRPLLVRQLAREPLRDGVAADALIAPLDLDPLFDQKIDCGSETPSGQLGADRLNDLGPEPVRSASLSRRWQVSLALYHCSVIKPFLHGHRMTHVWWTRVFAFTETLS